MSKLPGITMPATDPPSPQAKTISVDPIDDLLDELNDKQDVTLGEEEPEDLVPIDSVDKVEEEDVFAEDAPPPRAEEPSMNSETGEVPEKKGRRKYQRKGEMSEKQRAHLEKIRAKALENKKKRREEKEAYESEKRAEAEEKKDVKEKEKKIAAQRKKAEEAQRPPTPAERPASSGLTGSTLHGFSSAPPNGYTKDDLESAVVNAIHTYDTHRKEQKVLKKQKQAEDAQKSRQTRLIQQAINPEPEKDPWRQYFT
mgnify:CR=1 FL=1